MLAWLGFGDLTCSFPGTLHQDSTSAQSWTQYVLVMSLLQGDYWLENQWNLKYNRFTLKTCCCFSFHMKFVLKLSAFSTVLEVCHTKTAFIFQWINSETPQIQIRGGNQIIILLFLLENICCGYSLEVSCWGTSNDYHNICLCWEIRKI